MPDETREGLKALGHDIKPGAYTAFGSAQVILVHPDTGLYHGGSDSRRDGILGFMQRFESATTANSIEPLA